MQDGSTRPRRILQTRPRDVRGIPWVRRGFAGERYAGRRQKARPRIFPLPLICAFTMQEPEAELGQAVKTLGP